MITLWEDLDYRLGLQSNNYVRSRGDLAEAQGDSFSAHRGAVGFWRIEPVRDNAGDFLYCLAARGQFRSFALVLLYQLGLSARSASSDSRVSCGRAVVRSVASMAQILWYPLLSMDVVYNGYGIRGASDGDFSLARSR